MNDCHHIFSPNGCELIPFFFFNFLSLLQKKKKKRNKVLYVYTFEDWSSNPINHSLVPYPAFFLSFLFCFFLLKLSL